jgi:hypothetical protein
LAGRRRLEATGIHRRKGWQIGDLRTRDAGSEHGEMALLTLGKPARFKNGRFGVTSGLFARTAILGPLERVRGWRGLLGL